MREQRIAAVDCGIERKTTVKKNTSVALLGRKKKEAERLDYAALGLRRVRSDSKAAILIKLLASTAAPTHNSKRLRPSSRQRFMPRPRNSTEMVPSMPGSKALSFFEIGTLLVGFALVRFLSATLRDTNHLHTLSLAQLHILLTEETPIRTIQLWDVAEHFLVAFQRRFHVLFIVRVSLEHSYCVINPSFGSF
jgi:hypothetical protein